MTTLLVIDDDQAVLQVFQRLLGETATVVTATLGAEGVEQAAACDPDVVFLDVMLPDESGLEVFQQIHQRNPRIPILVISASADSDTAIEAMKLGAFDYLLKPLDFGHVREMVSKALDIRRLTKVPVS